MYPDVAPVDELKSSLFTSPADKPCIVEDLLDLPSGPIRKISSGGYLTAAITAGNDLYIWGGRPGLPKLMDELEDMPAAVNVNEHDILDVGVGENHIIVLTTEHRLFVVGFNDRGQLGVGGSARFKDIKQREKWLEVKPALKKEQRIVGVHAGYKNSFLLVEGTED